MERDKAKKKGPKCENKIHNLIDWFSFLNSSETKETTVILIKNHSKESPIKMSNDFKPRRILLELENSVNKKKRYIK